MLEMNVPDYYPAMYQDGYTPTEILAAMRKKLRQNIQEQRWNSSQLCIKMMGRCENIFPFVHCCFWMCKDDRRCSITLRASTH